MKNVRANRRCPRKHRAQSAYYPVRTFDVSGASRIVQRVICVGNRASKTCSARGANFIRTYKASVDVVDNTGPTTSIIADTPLARGAWVSGNQPLNYTAADNVGVRSAQAFASGRRAGAHQRACALAAPAIAYAEVVPMSQVALGQIAVEPRAFARRHSTVLGSRLTTRRAMLANSSALIARIDNTACLAAFDTLVEGGEAMAQSQQLLDQLAQPRRVRSRADRGRSLQALRRGPWDACTIGASSGLRNCRASSIQVPAQGEWTLSLWRRDAAGNESAAVASVPVTLRYDAEAPRLAFTQSRPADPTLISVAVVGQYVRTRGRCHRAQSSRLRDLADTADDCSR